MTFETKEQVLERVLAQEKPRCPHCDQEMDIWEVPPINFSDGLGWGTPYLFICFNDDCSLYKGGWDNMQENFAQVASYRCINYPGTDTYEIMPVFSSQGGQGQVVSEEVMQAEEVLKENIKRGFNLLATCYTNNDGVTVLRLLLDPTEPMRVRVKAAEMIGDIGSLDAIDPIRDLKFGNEILQQTVDEALKKIHKRHFTRECPFCAEIIKKRAKVCKHCNKEVAGR